MRLFRSGPPQQVGVSPLGISQDVSQCPAASPDTLVPSADLTVTFCSFNPNPETSLRWAWSIGGSVCSPPAWRQLPSGCFLVCVHGSLLAEGKLKALIWSSGIGVQMKFTPDKML